MVGFDNFISRRRCMNFFKKGAKHPANGDSSFDWVVDHGSRGTMKGSPLGAEMVTGGVSEFTWMTSDTITTSLSLLLSLDKASEW